MADAHSEPVWDLFRGLLRRSAFFVAHGLELLMFVAVVRLVEVGIEYMSGGHEVVFLKRIPLQYFIDGIDVGLLLIFAYKGFDHFRKM